MIYFGSIAPPSFGAFSSVTAGNRSGGVVSSSALSPQAASNNSRARK